MATRTVEIIESVTTLPNEGATAGADSGNFINSQSILLTNASQQSAAFQPSTNLISIQLPVDLSQSTVDLRPFRIALGKDPSAANSGSLLGMLLYPGTVYKIRVPATQSWKIALIEGTFQ